MPVALIFTGFTRHPKVRRAGEKAGWLLVHCFEYTAEFGTDGFIPTEAIAGFGLPGIPARLKALLHGDDRHGPLLHKVAGGYEINDYLEWNQRAAALAEQARAKSEARSKAGKKGAESRWGNGRILKPDAKPDGNGDGKPIANGMATGSQPDSSSSSPSSSSSSGLESPSSAVTEREPSQDQDFQLTDTQQRVIAGLAAELHSFRPQWDTPMYHAQLTRLARRQPPKPWPRIFIAMIAVAADPKSDLPHRVHADGYWWNDQDSRTQAALTRWTAAGHRNPAIALGANA